MKVNHREHGTTVSSTKNFLKGIVEQRIAHGQHYISRSDIKIDSGDVFVSSVSGFFHSLFFLSVGAGSALLAYLTLTWGNIVLAAILGLVATVSLILSAMVGFAICYAVTVLTWNFLISFLSRSK